ncbi:MAG: ABC transporter permease subunit, partial [Eubacteriales bacterium]
SRLDPSLIEAAKDLGANDVDAFFKITLPLSVPGIVSGVAMVFLPAMTNYVVLDMLYNSTYIMGSLIGSYFAAYNWNGGSLIALILLLLICVFTFFTRNLEDEDQRAGGGALL